MKTKIIHAPASRFMSVLHRGRWTLMYDQENKQPVCAISSHRSHDQYEESQWHNSSLPEWPPSSILAPQNAIACWIRPIGAYNKTTLPRFHYIGLWPAIDGAPVRAYISEETFNSCNQYSDCTQLVLICSFKIWTPDHLRISQFCSGNTTVTAWWNRCIGVDPKSFKDMFQIQEDVSLKVLSQMIRSPREWTICNIFIPFNKANMLQIFKFYLAAWYTRVYKNTACNHIRVFRPCSNPDQTFLEYYDLRTTP